MQLPSSKHCSGCYACYNACSKDAISMEYDVEGFRQPYINNEKCIDCGLCMKVCPILSGNNYNESSICYAGYSKKHRKKGSSGGIFSDIANYVLNNNGIVYGAAYDESFRVAHQCVSKYLDLYKLIGSKYVQSDINLVYRDIKQNLEKKRNVLFSGTPCQVDGLIHYLKNKKYDNLILIDIICHGVPSPLVFNRWIQDIEKKHKKISRIDFRKLDGWSSTAQVHFIDGKSKILRGDLESYYKAFYKCNMFRESCYRCQYANLKRPGDITLGDFWGIGQHGIPYDHSTAHGVSLILQNTSKGVEVINRIKDDIVIESRPIDEALKGQGNLIKSCERPEARNSIILDFLSPMSLSEITQKYNLINGNLLKYKIITLIKDSFINLGLFDYLKNIKHKLSK